MKPMSFEDAIKDTNSDRRHLLLGNGFSRACRDDIFAYDALFERAKLDGKLKDAFEALDTRDFEIVIDTLKKSSQIFDVYNEGDASLSEVLRKDADALREVLVTTIANSHPSVPNEISEDSYCSCRQFLSHFSKKYTLNYDLLLYWTLMQRELKPEVPFDDGFRTPDDGETTYVSWEVENAMSQSVYYLHGALHLFDAGSELQKFTWSNTGIRLTEQIRGALEDEKYPMFVAEGTSKSKLSKIKHSAYLARALQSFSNIGGTLFVFGHSFAENDEHILRLIEKGKITKLYIGLFGDHESSSNQRVISRADDMIQTRKDFGAKAKKKVNDLVVFYYDAGTAQPWGN